MDKKLIKYFIEEIKKKKQDKIDNGPIEVTVDQLWKYSGAIEEDSEEYTMLLKEKEYEHQYSVTIEAIKYLRARRWYPHTNIKKNKNYEINCDTKN